MVLAAHVAFGMGIVFSLSSAARAEQPEAARAALEELVVTATRRTTDLQGTAVAGTVFTGEGMEKKNVVNLVSIQYAAPSVTIADYGSANTFNMRGVGRSQVDIDIPSGVQMYRDGVPMFAGYFQNEPYYDMAGMEVLRGPQGTVAGKSASGGALFIRTRDPLLGESGGFFEAGFGNFDKWETTGAISVPLGERFAVRLAGNHQERDHFYDSITGNYTGDPGINDFDSLRLTIYGEPTEHWETKFKFDWNDLDFGGTPTVSFGEDPREPVNDAFFAYHDRSWRGIADIKYHFGNGMTFSSLTGYQDSDTVNNNDNNSGVGTYDPPDELPIAFLSKGNFTLFSQELNLVSDESRRLRWVAGVFYQEVDSSIPPPPALGFQLRYLLPGINYPFVASPWDNNEEDISAFGHIGYDLTDALELEVGVRYSHYQRRQQLQFMGSPDGGFSPLVPFEPVSREKISESSVDYKVGLNWTPQANHFLYAFVARGHTTGGINIAPPHNDYDEVEVLDFEAGWKGTLFDGRLHTQFGGYYQVLDNFQGVFQITGQLGAETRTAADDSTIYGAEFNLQALFDNLGVDFGGAYNRTRLGDFEGVVIPPEYAPFFPAGQTIVDLSDRQSPYSPELTLSVGAEYAFHLGANTTLTPRADFSYIGEQKDGLFDIPILEMESRRLLNLSLRLNSGAWYAAAYVTNATDQTYISGIQANGQKQYLGAPRMYGLKVGRSFEQ